MWKLVLSSLTAIGLLAAGPADRDLFLEHLRYLASDAMKGRGNRGPEIDLAAGYIATHFEKYGLLPGGDAGSYFQSFEVGVGHDLGPVNGLTIEPAGPAVSLQLNSDYLALSYGESTTVRGGLVFAGFGITAPDLNYDDYAQLDVRGKIVVVFEHEPQEKAQASPFAGKELTPYGTTLAKIMNARHRGAKGIILIEDAFNHSRDLPRDWKRKESIEKLGIHCVRLNGERSRWLIELSGQEPARINRSIHGQLTPYSFDFPEVSATLSIDVKEVRRRLNNVVGILPGQTRRGIVLGAHYDHLGLGDKSSLAPERKGEIHNGADDNASGTAGLLQLAYRLTRKAPRDTLIFAAFAAEELGLLGSRHYTNQASFAVDRTRVMINLDMIGRSNGSLLIGGVGTAQQFKDVLDELQKQSPLRFQYALTPRGPSDHLSFFSKKIPVLFFFSGLHPDYHRPSDDWEKVNVEGSHQILQVVEGLVRRLSARPGPLQFVDLGSDSFFEPDSPEKSYGPLFGSLPDMAWEAEGVRFAGIRDQSPAAIADLRPGDVLLSFDGKTIENLHDFTDALRAKQPGDQVEVIVLREGRLVRKSVRLVKHN